MLFSWIFQTATTFGAEDHGWGRRLCMKHLGCAHNLRAFCKMMPKTHQVEFLEVSPSFVNQQCSPFVFQHCGGKTPAFCCLLSIVVIGTYLSFEGVSAASFSCRSHTFSSILLQCPGCILPPIVTRHCGLWNVFWIKDICLYRWCRLIRTNNTKWQLFDSGTTTTIKCTE